MPLAALAVDGGVGSTSLRRQQPANTDLASARSVPTINPARRAAMTRSGGGVGVVTTTAVAMPQPAKDAAAVPVDLGRYANAVTTASTYVPPARTSSGPAGPSAADGWGVGVPTRANAQPANAPPPPANIPGAGSPTVIPAPATSQPGSQGQGAATGRPAPVGVAATPGDGEIRPMTLRPSAETTATHSAAQTTLSPMSASGSTSGSGSNSGSSGGGGGGGGGGNHQVQVWASNSAIIGSPFSATVESINSSPNLQSVVWTATGAIQAEPYSNSMGSFTPFGSLTHVFGLPLPDKDAFSSYWENTPGTYTVTAAVTFLDGVKASGSATVNVIAPTVDSFKVTSTPFIWYADQSDHDGFSMLTPITMAATVSVPASVAGPNYGGTIALIQKVDRTDTATNLFSGAHTESSQGLVLDTKKEFTDPAGLNYLYLDSQSQPFGNGQSGSFSVVDVPNTIYYAGVDKATGKGDFVMDLKVSITLEAHLVFQPTGGIWVNLATDTPIVMTGEEKYDLTTGWYTGTAPTPNGTNNQDTHQDYNNVTWTNWWGNPKLNAWNPPYTN